MSKNIKAIDFFCGAGGLTRGLLNSGIEVLAGVDNDEGLRTTYETNNAPSKFLCEDINEIDILSLRKELSVSDKDFVLYAACTPCQPFSTLNRMEGKDERKYLLLSFAELVRQAPPDFLIVENVPGLNNAYGKEIYEEFIDTISESGFNDIFADFLDVKDYGVPQRRKRFILLSSRHGKISPPKVSDKVSTVADYIKKYHPIKHGESSKRIVNHVARKLQPHHLKIVKAVPKNGGSRSDIKDTSILLKCHQKKPKVHKDVFGRMAWDLPAPTLTCRCTDIYCGRFIHPTQDRGISLREAAAIQTFPDDYEFFGKFIHIARQIGNAVPVKFAQRLGETIVSSYANKGI